MIFAPLRVLQTCHNDSQSVFKKEKLTARQFIFSQVSSIDISIKLPCANISTSVVGLFHW